MSEMILLYLGQTTTLINSMTQAVHDNDWELLYAAVHKIIPSFAIIGMSVDYENMAKKIQEYASSKQHLEDIQTLVAQLEIVCSQACAELEEELNLIKKTN